MIADCIYRGDKYQLSAEHLGRDDLRRIQARRSGRVTRVLAVDGGQSGDPRAPLAR